MAGWRAGGIALLVVVSMLVGGVVTAQLVGDDAPATATPAADDTATATSQPVVQTPANGASNGAPTQVSFEDLPALVDGVIDSVVRIELENNGEGSGVVLDTDGHILTNYHVIESTLGSGFGGGARIIAHLNDGSAAVATVLGVDPFSDLAVIQADFDPAALKPATLGDSNAVEIGEPVFAIGSPFSNPWTVTAGIVSATGRETTSAFSDRRILNVIQTDASLNPGNSGGPLFNGEGHVIGINTSITGPQNFLGSVGLGFAVPSNIALRFLPQMLAGEEVQHTQLGVSGQPLNEVIAADEGLAITRGYRVAQVSGAAVQAGLQAGDVITHINGAEIVTFEDLAVEIDSYEVGDEVTLTVNRGGSELELTATLQAWAG